MKRVLSVILMAMVSLQGWAIKTAGQLLVEVSATTASGVGVGGNVTSWANSGTLGDFAPTGVGPVYQPVGSTPALYFDGTAQSPLVGPVTPMGLTGGNSWTIEAWLRKDSFKGNEEIFVAWTLRGSVEPPHDRMLEARYSINKDIAIEHYGNNNLPWGDQLPVVGEWHHVVITRDSVSKEEKLYVDGRLTVAGMRGTIDVAPDGDIVIGATWNGNRAELWGGYMGYIGQLRIHSDALSVAGVTQNYLDERTAYGRTSDPDCVWEGSTGLVMPWETAANWLGGNKPGLSGSSVTFMSGTVASLTSDAGVLEQFNPYNGGLVMSDGARLSMALDSRVYFGRGAGNAFTLDVSEGTLEVPGTTEGWVFLGLEGGACEANVGGSGGPAEIFAKRDFQLGMSAGSYGSLTIGADGGAYSSDGWFYIGLNPGGTGIVTVADGGIIGCKNPTYDMSMRVGHNGGYGELIVTNGGVVSTRGQIVMTPASTENAFAGIWLESGGTLEASRIFGEGDTGTRVMYIDGGIIANRWSANNNQDLFNNFMSNFEVYLQENGVTFDILDDTRVAVWTPLATDPALGGTPDGGIVKRGGGTLVLHGANTFTGPIDIQAGGLWFMNADALPSGCPITMSAGGSIGWAIPGGAEALLNMLDPGTTMGELVLFEANAGDTIDLSQFPYLTLRTLGHIDFTGTYTPYGGIYKFAPQDGRILYTGAISGAASVVVDASLGGGVELTGNNTYTGSTTVSGSGWLMMSSVNAIGTGSIRLTGGASLRLAAAGIPPTLTSRITTDSEGYLILGAEYANYPVDLTGLPSMHVGSDQAGLYYASTITPAGNTYRLGGGWVPYFSSGNLGFALSNLGDNGATPRDVVIEGGGLVALLAGNDHSGGTVVTNKGVLFLREDAGLGAVPTAPGPRNLYVDGGVVRNGNANFETHENRGWEIGPGGIEFHPWGGHQTTIKGNVIGTGDILITDGGTVAFAGAANTWQGSVDIRADATFQIGAGQNFSWESGNVIKGNGGWLGLSSDNLITFSDWFAMPLGAGGANLGLRKRGTGALLLDDDQLYARDTRIEEGTLMLGLPTAIPAIGNTQISSVLDLNGHNGIIGAILGGGEIIDATGTATTLSVGANNGSATFIGSVAPGITLTKTGTGTQNLNTYNINNAAVEQGILTTINPTAPTGTISIANAATLRATGGDIPYADAHGYLIARYYDTEVNPNMFDSPEKILTFLTRTPNLTTTSHTAGDTLDFGNDGSRFATPYDDPDKGNFVSAFTGAFLAETTGEYTFGTRSDDGSLLLIDNEIVVDSNTMHGWNGSLVSGTVFLNAGTHSIIAITYEAGGGQGLTVYMTPPGVTVDWSNQEDTTQPTLPQSLLSASAPSRWTLLDATGANLDLTANAAVELNTTTDVTLTGGNLTTAPGSALIKRGNATHTFAPTTMNVQGMTETVEGELAFGTGGRLGNLTIGNGTTLSTSARLPGMNTPAGTSGLIGKYYNIAPAEGFPAFNELNTYEAYLAPHQPAVVESTLFSGNTLTFNGGANFPPPYNNAENFQVLWKGRILLPEEDEYIFYTASDDGSMLFINGEAIVRNHAMQGVTERSGTKTLTAGWHDIAISFYQGGGGYGMFARIEGGGLGKQDIPNTMLAPIPGDLTDGTWLGAALTTTGTLTGNGTLALDGDNTALNLNITADCTFGGGATGNPTTILLKTGPATLTLTGDSSEFHGKWHVLEGELHIADGAILGAPGSELCIAANATVTFANDTTILGRITGNGTLRFNGSGTVTLGDDLTEFLGDIDINPGQTIILANGITLDASRLNGIAHLTLLDGTTLYCLDPADVPPSLTTSNATLVLGINDANKNDWALDTLTLFAGTTQQVTACVSGLYGKYYNLAILNEDALLSEEQNISAEVMAAFPTIATAEAYLAQQTLTMTVPSWHYGDGIAGGGSGNDIDCFHPAPYDQDSSIFFAIQWKGKIRITDTGKYTFGTCSDDQSMLFIDGQTVINSNYNQSPTTRTATLELAAGLHDITILYCQIGGGHYMDAYIQRPGDPDLIPLPNDMLIADLPDTLAHATVPPYTLTATTVAVENAGHGTVDMLMGGTLAFSSLWIDTGAVLDVIGAAAVAGPTLSMTIPAELPTASTVLVGDFTQTTGGLNLAGVTLLPVEGSESAKMTYRNGKLYLTRVQGTIMILR